MLTAQTGYFKEIYKYIYMICKYEYTTLLSTRQFSVPEKE